jgi:hypothetical protein
VKTAAEFAEFTQPEPNTGCLLWLGGGKDGGYGTVAWGPRAARETVGAHRKAWELVHGPIPAGLGILHKCDTRFCVNPDHLFLGTAADNAADMVAKGRSVRGERQWRWTLSYDQRRQVVARVRSGERQRDVAREFGVSRGLVCKLMRDAGEPSRGGGRYVKGAVE